MDKENKRYVVQMEMYVYADNNSKHSCLLP